MHTTRFILHQIVPSRSKVLFKLNAISSENLEPDLFNDFPQLQRECVWGGGGVMVAEEVTKKVSRSNHSI